MTTTKKTEERRKDVGLITIKSFTESRPYVIQTVIDAKTERRLSVEEAVRAKILDQQRGVYVNSSTEQEMTLADALDSGLIEVEYEEQEDLANGDRSVHITLNLIIIIIITTRCTIMRSAVLLLHVVCPSVRLSVCLSVCDVGGS